MNKKAQAIHVNMHLGYAALIMENTVSVIRGKDTYVNFLTGESFLYEKTINSGYSYKRCSKDRFFKLSEKNLLLFHEYSSLAKEKNFLLKHKEFEKVSEFEEKIRKVLTQFAGASLKNVNAQPSQELGTMFQSYISREVQAA